MAKTGLNIHNYNNDFLIITSVDPQLLAAAGKSIFEQQFHFVDEVIVAEVEVCVKLNQSFDESHLDLINQSSQVQTVVGQTYNLPIHFGDTEDWSAIETHVGLSKEAIISKVIDTELSVAMFGFLPGFVYLKGLDASLHVPRKTVPSKYVKANSLAIGGKYMGIYSIDSPSGWHVIGQVPLSILNLESLPPLDFNIGDTIRLVTIDQQEFDQMVAKGISFKSYNSK